MLLVRLVTVKMLLGLVVGEGPDGVDGPGPDGVDGAAGHVFIVQSEMVVGALPLQWLPAE